MDMVLEYALYAAVFMAIVLLVEGLWRLINGALGEGRALQQRLAKARPQQAEGAEAPRVRAGRSDPLSGVIAARLPHLDATLTAAHLPFGPTWLLAGGLLLFLAVQLGLRTIGCPALIALGAAAALAVAAPAVTVLRARAKRRQRFLDQLPQAVDLIARGLQAGHPVASAMAVVGERMPDPIGGEFRTVTEQTTYGLTRDAALQAMLKRFPVAELRMFVASLEVTRETGGNLADVFLKLAAAIRGKQQFRRKVESISAEGRLSFWVVAGLPFVVGGLLMLLRPTFYLDVAHDPLFWPMISAAPILMAIGATIIWRMVNVKV